MANTCSFAYFSSQGSPSSSGAPLRARPRRTARSRWCGSRPTTRSGRSRSGTTAATSGMRSGGSSRQTTCRAPTCASARRSSCPRTDWRDPAWRRSLRENRWLVDLDLVFLGTSGSAPTPARAPAALLVRRGGERLLFDCAEGTQRQLMRSVVGLPDLEHIFITHFHADHYLGLPGMLKTFQLRQREMPLTVYGPPGLRDLFGGLRRVFGKVSYPIELVEARAGEALERDGYRILVFPVHHGVSAVGYALDEHDRPGRFDNEAADALGIPIGPERGALQRGESVTLSDGHVLTPDAVLGPARPGRRLVIPGDTAPVETVRVLAEGADVLVHEATFGEEE